MLTGVLVVAFPVSVFSDLWSKEVERINKSKGIETGLDDDDDRTDGGNDPISFDGGGSIINPSHDGGVKVVSGYESTKADEVDKLISNIGTQFRPSTVLGTGVVAVSSAAAPTSSNATTETNNDNKQSDDLLVMRQEDLQELLSNLDTMRSSELRIRHILSKYNIETSRS